MKHWLKIVPACAMVFSLNAQESENPEDYEIQEEVCDEEICENDELCIPQEERGYSRRYYCPHRYSDYYDYLDKDEDATWPGKLENSFMEDLMR
jgi:hypothetical protein